jgi:hypothetical protein
MPTVYWAMKKAADDLPIVGPFALGLGVREPPSSHADVDLDVNSLVVLNGRGISVARHWRDLPKHCIPIRLRENDSGGGNPQNVYCWKTGVRPFTPRPVAAGLDLVLKPHDLQKGNVVPSGVGSLAQFQADLAATRAQWVIDEA